MEFCQWLQSTGLSTWLRESTWGFPLLAALHVLGIAWFGGALLKDLPGGKRVALAFMILTGAVLFYMSPVRCITSYSFRVKMAVMAIAAVEAWGFSKARYVALVCWVVMIFAGRGIAFF